MTEIFEATAPKVPHAGSRSGRVSSLVSVHKRQATEIVDGISNLVSARSGGFG